MIFPKKCLRCPLFPGYICWPKVVGALLLLSAPYFLSGVPADKPMGFGKVSIRISLDEKF